ncbi:MAG: GGDEF domain-containing protein [Eubacterium sp.]|nr:GGDEF domain-containing protein [Eubacterium sp.]
MTKEYIDATTSRLMLMHILVYVCAGAFLLFVDYSALTYDLYIYELNADNPNCVPYILIIYILGLGLNILINYKNAIFKKNVFGFKCMIEMAAYAAAGLFFDLYIFYFATMLLVEMFVYVQLLSFDVSDDSIILLLKKIIGGIFLSFTVFCQIGSKDDSSMILLASLFSVIIIVLGIVISNYIHGAIKYYDKQISSLSFDNENLLKENANLLTYQEKVHHVNNEINYQKINLAKANRDLKAVNSDIRTLVNIMKGVSMTRDVQKCMDILLENIMEDRKPDICAFYVKENTFIDNEAYQKILVAKEGSNDAPASNVAADKIYSIFMADIFRMMEDRGEKSVLPMTIDGRKSIDCPDFGINMNNMIAVPAYLSDKMYGVLVVGDRSEGFFENGYSFYESAVFNLSATLQNIKLYLKMQDMSRRDGLTGIYNRAYFNEIFHDILSDASDNKKNLSVAMLDIDKFKSVNDTYGHLAGDAVIKMVAGVFSDYAKKYDGVACRYGGEEFVLILPDKGVDEAYDILMKAHDSIIENVVKFEDNTIYVNSSIGISSFPETTTDCNQLLNRSDEAMYFGKEHGRGVVIIDGREEECLARK